MTDTVQILLTANKSWGIAKKTASILATPMTSVFGHGVDLSAMLINTLEGPQVPVITNLLCQGMTVREPWQQKPAALLKKYKVADIVDGKLVCEPLPENEVEYFKITADIADHASYIIGQWGSTIDGVENLQNFRLGDYVCRQTYDHTDQWIVREGLFDATYGIIKKV